MILRIMPIGSPPTPKIPTACNPERKGLASRLFLLYVHTELLPLPSNCRITRPYLETKIVSPVTFPDAQKPPVRRDYM